MKNIILLSTIVLLFFSSCLTSNCPNDLKIGQREMSEKSKSFINYKGKPTLIFKDNEGKELVFTSPEGVRLEKTKISVYKQCTEFKFDGHSTYKYFEGETKNVVFFSKNPDYSLGLGVYPTILRIETEMFYDIFKVNVNGVGAVGRGEIVTDVYFTEKVESDEFNIDSPMDEIEEITLNNTIYKNIYRTENFDGRFVYYSKDKGVVGFIDGDKVFNLDTIIQ